MSKINNSYYDDYIKYKKRYVKLKNFGNKIMKGSANVSDNNILLMELAVDVGTTNVKLALRQFGYSLFNIYSYPSNGDDMLYVFSDPDLMPDRLIKFINDKIMPNNSYLFKISFAISGIVESGEREIKKSFALNNMSKDSGKKYDGYNITNKFKASKHTLKIKPVYVLNDASASGIGAIILKHKDKDLSGIEFPLLSLTLGTGPAVCVVTRENQQYKIAVSDSKLGVKITVNGIKKDIFYYINKASLDYLINKAGNKSKHTDYNNIPKKVINSYSEYVRLSLLSLLLKYKEIFDTPPKTILISGGLANIINEQQLSNISTNIIILKGEKQKNLLHMGSSAYEDIKSFIDISWTL